MKSKICGALAVLSFFWMLGVAGNSDLGYEPDLRAMCIKLAIGLIVFVASVEIGGFSD